jgi:putative Ca2+/H+ antiporter (TMEM165/GDT1 family)
VNPGVALASFGLIFLAELPDKTFIASLVLGTRFAPVPVWIGVCAAFTVHTAIAVSAGRLLSLLPHQTVDAIVAAMFFGGAVYLLVVPEEAEERRGSALAGGASAPTPARVVLSSFVVIFLAEWGDLTQILTANLAARYRDPTSVAVGAVLGLWTVAALAMVAATALRAVNLRLVRRFTAMVLLALAVFDAVAAAGA